MNHTNKPQRLATVFVLLGSWACAGVTEEGTIGGTGVATGGLPSSVRDTTTSSDLATNGGASSVRSRTASGGDSLTEASRSTGGTTTKGDPRATGGATENNGETGSIGAKPATDAAATGGRDKSTGTRNSSGGSSQEGARSSNKGRMNTGGARDRSAAGGATSSKEAAGGATSTNSKPSSGPDSNNDGTQSSSGCGKANYPAACSTKGTPCSIDVGGNARTYYVYLPDKYDASQLYPLVFQFHPMGGTAEQAISIPSIRSKFTAIYVTPQGLTSGSSTGWANTNGQDMDFTKAMLSTVQESYCVDKSRIFSTGFSYGGMMSYAIGCEMGDVFRAVAPMSGALYSGCKNGTHAVAMWGSHGLSDNVVPIADGRAGRDAILKRNHCGTETVATTPSPCVSYQGCDFGYPTTWCEFEGSHAPPSFAASAIVDFFKQF